MASAPLPTAQLNDHAQNAGFEALREWRTRVAREKQLPPYVIMSDAVMRGIVAANPTTLEALAGVRGVGAAKTATYGDAILTVLRGAVAPATEAQKEAALYTLRQHATNAIELLQEGVRGHHGNLPLDVRAVVSDLTEALAKAETVLGK